MIKRLSLIALLQLLAAAVVPGAEPAAERAAEDGAVWRITTVDDSRIAGRWSSLAYSSGGDPAISYDDDTDRCLKFARRVGPRWVIEVVDRGGAPSATSLAFDPAGMAAISYSFRSTKRRELCFAQREAKGWRISVIDPNGTGARGISLAMSPAGSPSVAYSGSDAGRLMLAEYVDGKWSVSELPGQGFCSDLSLVFRPAGDPVVSYVENGILKLASKTNGTWKTEPIDRNARSRWTSLRIDDQGSAHVAFATLSPKAVLHLASNGGGTWDVETVDDGIRSGRPSALALLPEGRAAIAYCEASDAANAGLKYAARNNGGWRRCVIDQGVGAGYQMGLAFDRNGSPSISYYDVINRSLKFAEFDPASGSADGAR